VNRELLDALFHHYVLMKRGAVDEEDVDNDVPMLLYVGDEPMETESDAAQVLCIVVPGGRDDVCAALAHTMAQAFIPNWACILADGFVAKDLDVPDEYKHAGGLIELAALGDANIKECLTITAVDHAGDQYANARTYWYDSDGDIWFDDEDGPGEKSEGPMIDVLRDVTSLWGMTHVEILSEIMKRGPFLN
jgi:hypothetical protein